MTVEIIIIENRSAIVITYSNTVRICISLLVCYDKNLTDVIK